MLSVFRDGVTRRQGDLKWKVLCFYMIIGDLAGSGTPNGSEDLQAPTKFYVDNTAYSS